MPHQLELPLPFPEFTGDEPAIPVRMINEYVYCPRLAYLEWVQAEWRKSADTVEGNTVHRRVDVPGGRLPDPEEAGEIGPDQHIHARSVTLSSSRLGIVAKIDLVEASGGKVRPVDYKKGRRRHVATGAYQPERVQVCAQALILREHGYEVDFGYLYFAGSRERVPVFLEQALIDETLSAIHALRLLGRAGRIPPPLIDSPKCVRCSLAGICLPDETNFLRGADTTLRPLAVGITEAFPLHVQSHHARISKNGDVLEVFLDTQSLPVVARLSELSQVVLSGNASITTPAIHELLRREIPLVWTSHGGWYLGHTQGVGHKNVELRTAQYRASFDERSCLKLARGLVVAKLVNQRVMLRRNWRGEGSAERALSGIEAQIRQAKMAPDLPTLLGVEGAGAAIYFGNFGSLLKKDPEAGFAFDFHARNRRPPADPVNALLSFAYAVLARQWVVTLASTGFDPYRGLYHQPRYGRPSLALDLMEPFRPLIADSSVLQAINNGEIRPTDFTRTGTGVSLDEDGRKRFVGTIERRLEHEITHPIFQYKLSYRRLFEVQARLLGRFLLGEIDDYPNFLVR